MIRKFSLAAAVLMTAAGSALAADLPSRRPPPPVYTPPPPLFTWTGFYVGGQIGYGFGRDGAFTSNGFGTHTSINGVIGGAHVGYNYQINQFVVGLEGDVDGTSLSKTYPSPTGLASYYTNIPVQGSVRGRVGYAVDRALFYATGGVAFADIKNSFTTTTGYSSNSTGRVGWTVGGGIDYAITNNWSVRAEYRYSDFGRTNSFVLAPTSYTVANHLTEHAVRVGLSYKFDMYAPPTPVLAKY